MNASSNCLKRYRRCLVVALAWVGALHAVTIERAGAQAGSAADGPYISHPAEGRMLVKSIDASGWVTEGSLRVGETFAVPSVGSLPAFKVQLRPPDPVARDEIRLPASTPILVIADTHGEYEILGELLRKQKIVDDSMQWSFGKGHVVVLGDVFDRGQNQIEILWLIYELQAQAAKAGGGVHLLIGNHEAMVMGGDLRYLNPKYQRTARAFGAASYTQLVDADTVLGSWLRTRPTVLKIRDLLCLHGGISPQLVAQGLTLPQINATVRDALGGAKSAQVEFLMGPLGPLWYRGYFTEANGAPGATAPDIDAMRRYFGVDKIIVGHTRVPTVTLLYGGKVIAVQVYPHRDGSSGRSVMEALLIKGRQFNRARIDGALEPL